MHTVTFGLPFNGVVPLWHEDGLITWHQSDIDLAEVLGLGLVEEREITEGAPAGWSQRVEVGRLMGNILELKAITPTGKRAIKDVGSGARIGISDPLPYQQAMGEFFDADAFSVHIARMLLRGARDGLLTVFTLHESGNPQTHHLLSVSSTLDELGYMYFHLVTMVDMSEVPSWAGYSKSDGVTSLDMSINYSDLLGRAEINGVETAGEALDAGKLISFVRPAVDALLKPGFPFALGASVFGPKQA